MTTDFTTWLRKWAKRRELLYVNDLANLAAQQHETLCLLMKKGISTGEVVEAIRAAQMFKEKYE